MTYEDTNVNKVEELDLVRFTITVPRSRLEDSVVEDLRAHDYPDETVRIVGLLGYLTEEYGYQYEEELLDRLLFSMQANNGFDDDMAQRFRAALEAGIREHHDNAGSFAA